MVHSNQRLSTNSCCFSSSEKGDPSSHSYEALVAGFDAISSIVSKVVGSFGIMMLIIPVCLVLLLLVLMFRRSPGTNQQVDYGGDGGGGDDESSSMRGVVFARGKKKHSLDCGRESPTAT